MDMKCPIDDEIDEVLKNKQKNDQIKSRLSFCAYQALEVNEFGVELMENLKLRLFGIVGVQDQQTMAYVEGQHDIIRMLLGMIHEHKNQ